MTESVSSHIDVEASPDEILGVLVDFESYPQWARQVKAARVLSRDDQGRPERVEFEVSPGPLPKLRYVLRYTYRDDGIAWTFVEGDVKDIRGAYVLEPRDGATAVTYELAIDPGKIPLPGFVKARAAREITRVALQELKRRVELG
jgi:ribosome-associated toxin RatA of RatAB toxin-antitoxin module